MSNPPKTIPHDVQELLDKSEVLISAIESKEKSKSPTRPVGQAMAQALENPAPLPEMPQESQGRTPAMEYLLRSRGYLLGEDVRLRTQKLTDESSQIVSESLNAFFMQDVPDLEATAYKVDARDHMTKVLATAGPTAPTRIQHKNIKTQYRTLDKSISVFKRFMAEPVPVGASIFTHAIRGFTGSYFLLEDLCEALRIDAKSESEAAELILNCLKSSLSDEKAGEMLLVGELARARAELRDTNILLERNAFEAKNLLLQLERRRQSEVGALKEAVAQERSKREEEGEALLEKAQESALEIETLRALVDAIRADESVQEIARLKERLADAAETEERQKTEITQLEQQLAVAEKAFSDFKIEASAAEEQIETLRFEVRRADSEREICKSCGEKVHAQAKQISDDVQSRLRRNEEIIARETEVEQKVQKGDEIPQLLEQLSKVAEADGSDAIVFKMDMLEIVQELVLIEHHLESYPTVEQLQDIINTQKAEINRLKSIEVEFFELKAAHKKALEQVSNRSGIVRTEGTGITDANGSNNTSLNQRLAENQITLLRTQPLYFLIPKQFDIKLQEASADGVHPFSVTSSYVQCVIYKFVSHTVQASLPSNMRFTDFLSLRLEPPRSNCPEQMDEPISAIFTGFVHEEHALSESSSKQQDAELVVNKVAYVLNKYNDGSSSDLIEDKSGFLELGSALIMEPLTADELEFLLFVFALACGGIDPNDVILKKELYRIRLSDEAPEKYLTLRRAFVIVQVVLNKAVQSEFLTKLLESGRHTDLVREVPLLDVPKFDVCDMNAEIAGDLLPSNAALEKANLAVGERVGLVELPYFVIQLLKAYRTEQLVRLEALRVIYAADMLESGDRFITDSSRYRIVREVIEEINPLASVAIVDAAYLDTIWRSPNALWAILIDACRVRGVFSSALRLPPLDCVMQLCGGYKHESSKYDFQRLFQRLAQFMAEFHALADHLALLDAYELKSLGVQVETIAQTDLSAHNILMIIAMMKGILLQVIDLICAYAAAGAADPSQASVPDGGIGPRVNKQTRLPAELYVDVIEGLMPVVASLLGWTERERGVGKPAKKAETKQAKK